MPTSGGQPGNENRAKATKLAEGLRKAIARDDWKRFNAGCEKVAEQFGAGEPWAIQFVFDRIDGKPKQQVEVSGDQDNPIAIRNSYIDTIANAAAAMGRSAGGDSESLAAGGE